MKRKSISFIHVLGLTLGMVAGLVILLYVHYESSFDRHNKNASRIYRVELVNKVFGKKQPETALTMPGLVHFLRSKMPQVETATRFIQEPDVLFYTDNNQKLSQQHLLWVDPDFFNVFTISLQPGSNTSALSKPGMVFISESTAQKLFPDKSAYGQIVKVNQGWPFQVAGIFKDIPPTSHFKVDFLCSYSTLVRHVGPFFDQAWEMNMVCTYIKLKPYTSADQFKQEFNKFLMSNGADPKKFSQTVLLRPLLDIHLKSDVLDELLPDTGNYFLIVALLLVAIIILLTAWINFINLSTAKSIERSRETGIRKVNGATKGHLLYQFLTESIIINLLAGVLTFLILIFILPVFSNYLNLDLPFQFWNSLFFWIFFAGLIIGGGIISGLIPAWIQANFKPTDALKGGLIKHTGGMKLRKILLSVQFIATITLITCTLIVYLQIHYLQSMDKGFERKNILSIWSPNSQIEKVEKIAQSKSFINEVQKISGVVSACASEVIPGITIPQRMPNIYRAELPPIEKYTFNDTKIDENYFKTFGIHILAGQNFSPNDTLSKNSVILNVSAIRMLGFKTPEEALGNNLIINIYPKPFQIIGIVNDYSHSWSGKENEPVMFSYSYSWYRDVGHYSIRFEERADKRAIINKVSKLWTNFYPNDPFDYIMVDEYYNMQYASLFRFNKCFILFSMLAIFISGMGLIGYCNYSTILKRKEIALRKTMGASNSSIMFTLYIGYFKIFTLSTIIGTIASIYFKDLLLENYPNKVTISPFFYFIPLFIILILILLTVSYQVVKASMEPPLKALQYE
jgi:putative ABC transport system permease protein